MTRNELRAQINDRFSASLQFLAVCEQLEAAYEGVLAEPIPKDMQKLLDEME